jgi:hypothetical protein
MRRRARLAIDVGRLTDELKTKLLIEGADEFAVAAGDRLVQSKTVFRLGEQDLCELRYAAVLPPYGRGPP